MTVGIEKVEREYRKSWIKLTGFEFIDSGDTFRESANDNMKFVDDMANDARKMHSEMTHKLDELIEESHEEKVR